MGIFREKNDISAAPVKKDLCIPVAASESKAAGALHPDITGAVLGSNASEAILKADAVNKLAVEFHCNITPNNVDAAVICICGVNSRNIFALSPYIKLAVGYAYVDASAIAAHSNSRSALETHSYGRILYPNIGIRIEAAYSENLLAADIK